MIKKLLVCTDGSSYGDVACQYAFLLAKALKAELTGLHVLDVRMIEGPALSDFAGVLGVSGYYAGLPQFRLLMESKGNAIKDNFLSRAKEADVAADFRVESGHPVHVILEQEKGCDLLIIGQRGENEQFGRELIGSMAERITRRASRSCLVTPGRYEPIGTILAACDGSPISGKVASLAASLARALGASLAVATVADKITTGAAQEIANEARDACAGKGCLAQVLVMEGHASEAILDCITRQKHDLIVMGAHAHTRIQEWFVGCTSQSILANSGIPALLVR